MELTENSLSEVSCSFKNFKSFKSLNDLIVVDFKCLTSEILYESYTSQVISAIFFTIFYKKVKIIRNRYILVIAYKSEAKNDFMINKTPT